MDGLHHICIYPGMPAHLICLPDRSFDEFVSGLLSYIVSLLDHNFCNTIAVRMNSDKPVAFNEKADSKYTNCCMKVHRKSFVSVDIHHFNKLAKSGLLDPQYTIGKYSSFLP
jgi:hypothetical protein